MRIQRTWPSAASAMSSLVLVGLIEEPLWFFLFPMSIILFHMASSAVNDLSDYSADKVNAPDRVFPSGQISKNALQILFAFIFVSGVLTSFFISHIYFLVVVTFGFIYVLSYSYGPALKNYPLSSIMYYSLSGSVAPYVMASLLAYSFGLDGMIFAFLLAMLATCAVTGSMGDYKGDITNGKRTFPVALGFHRARYVLAAMVLGAAVIYPILYYVFNFKAMFPILLVLPLCLRTVLFYLILHYRDPESFYRLGPLYRTIIAVDMIIFALSIGGEQLMFRASSLIS